MEPSIIEKADAPAKENGAEKTKSGNINVGQAAVQLLAMMQKKAEVKPTETATETVAPATEVNPSPETTANPAAEVTATSEAPVTETAATETTEGTAPETEADNVHSQSQFTPEQQEIFNKRIQREIAKTKSVEDKLKSEYEAKLAELQSKVNQAPAQAETPAPVVIQQGQPLAEINDLQSLGKLQQTAKEAVRYGESVLYDPAAWREINVDDPANPGVPKAIKVHSIGQGKDQMLFTEQELRKKIMEARITLEDHVPSRAQFLTARENAQKEAYTRFGFLKDKSSPEYQMVEAARRNPANAAILSMPNADYAFGLMIKGMRAVEAEEAAAKAKATAPATKPKVAAKPPSDQVAVGGSTSPVREPAGNQAQAKRQAQIRDSLKKGNINPADAAKLLR